MPTEEGSSFMLRHGRGRVYYTQSYPCLCKEYGWQNKLVQSICPPPACQKQVRAG